MKRPEVEEGGIETREKGRDGGRSVVERGHVVEDFWGGWSGIHCNNGVQSWRIMEISFSVENSPTVGALHEAAI